MIKIIDKFYSDAAGHETPYMALIPDRLKETDDKPFVLTVHGMTDSVETWLWGTKIENYLEDHGFCIALTFAENSYYTDMADGDPYYTMVTKDFNEFLIRKYGFSRKRSKRFVMGNSMGGYGAFKIALSERDYCAAVSFSGVTDIVYRFRECGFWHEDGVKNWGEDYASTLEGSKHDLYALVKKVEASGNERPVLRQICGTEDYLYEDNIRFRDFMLSRNGWNYEYAEDSGVHFWDFWDRKLPGVLDFFESFL